MKKTEIPKEIQDALNTAASQYSESKATTNAGAVLRFIARFIKPTTIIKIFAHKMNN